MSGQLTTDRVQRRLLTTLATWGAVNTIAGTVLWLRSDQSAPRAFGRQTAAWGAVDLAIAGVGFWRSRTTTPSAIQLRTTLLLNSGLDVGYVGGGLWWRSNGAAIHRWFRGYDPAAAPGDGSAIVIQGAFLLLLDGTFAWQAGRAVDGDDPTATPQATT